MLSEGLVQDDPWVGANLSLGRSRRLPRALTATDLDRLLSFLRLAARIDAEAIVDPNAVRERPHQSTTLLAVALMVATGVRVHEVVGLRCRDIDLAGRTVRLVRGGSLTQAGSAGVV
jgi:integrase